MKWFTTFLVALSTAAAIEPPPAEAASRGFTLVARTEHVSYFGHGGRRVDVERSEAFLSRLEGLFGALPAEWHLEYHRHPSAADIRDHAGIHAVGLTDLGAGRIDSVRDFHPHELIHAVAGRLGRCPVFFAEGLAVALSSEGRWGGRDVDAIARDALAAGVRVEGFLTSFTEQDPELGYPLAGSFVAFLLDRYGIDPFLLFLEGCGPSSRGWETAFRRAYGHAAARELIAWQASLRRGDAPRWSWNDTASWPESLRRPQVGGVGDRGAVARPTGRADAVSDRADVLLSAERDSESGPVRPSVGIVPAAP